MSGLDDIPIKVAEGDAAELWVPALLQELRDRLTTLLEDGEPAQIDLSSLPIGPEDRAGLRRVLGSGEVEASIQALGETRVQETATPGLWWITHHNAEGEVVAEFLDISLCPEILVRDPEEVRAGLDHLDAGAATGQ